MKCPKCHSEVGNQPVCPYCGGTMYIQDVAWNRRPYQGNTTIPVNEVYMASRPSTADYQMEQKLRDLNTKTNLMMILLGGNLMLLLLLIVVIMLK